MKFFGLIIIVLAFGFYEYQTHNRISELERILAESVSVDIVPVDSAPLTDVNGQFNGGPYIEVIMPPPATLVIAAPPESAISPMLPIAPPAQTTSQNLEARLIGEFRSADDFSPGYDYEVPRDIGEYIPVGELDR